MAQRKENKCEDPTFSNSETYETLTPVCTGFDHIKTGFLFILHVLFNPMEAVQSFKEQVSLYTVVLDRKLQCVELCLFSLSQISV